MNTSQLKNIIEKSFNEASAGFDLPALRFFDHGASYLAKSLTLKGNEKILDLATGTGKVALEVAKRLDNGSVLGIDISKGMLDQARLKANKIGLKNIQFECQDVENLNLQDAFFDGICCGFGVHFWEDMEAMLKSFLPKIKSGGFFAMTSFAIGSFEPQASLCLERFRQYGVKLPDSYTWERLGSAQQHLDLLNAVGLKDIQTQSYSAGYPLKSFNEWWDIICYTGFRSFLNQLSPDQVQTYRQEHLSEIEATRNEQGIPLKVEILCSVVKV